MISIDSRKSNNVDNFQSAHRENAGKFGHQVNSDSHLQTV